MATREVYLPHLPGIVAALGEGAAGLDLSRPFQTVALYLAAQARRCFDEQRSPDGVPWAPLKAPSAKRGGPSAKALRDTDVLMASLAGRAAGHVEDVSRAGLLWGTNVPYAGFHQEGTRTIPARPFLGVTPAMVGTIERILVDYIQRELARQL